MLTVQKFLRSFNSDSEDFDDVAGSLVLTNCTHCTDF